MVLRLGRVSLGFTLLALAACSAASNAGSGSLTGGAGGSGGDAPASGKGGDGGSDPSEGGPASVGITVGTGSTGTGTDACDSAEDADEDMDGFTKAQGDCNDCDKNVSPGAIEVVITEPGEDGTIPEPADEDCDGTIDNPLPATCDTGLALESTSAVDAARALELCHDATGSSWGLISAQYMRAGGAPVQASPQYGIQSAYGPNVTTRGGASMLNLSSGRARLPGQPGACGACDCGSFQVGSTPDGSSFPQTSPQCPGGGPGTDVYDDIALEVRLRAPTNATGFAFDFFFYTFEYPDYICGAVNDQFIAWMQPAPAAAPNGNISFDATGNPISVNAAFFQVCSGCALGEAQMAGTGFDNWTCGADDGNAGGTGWLQTQAPVVGGQEVTLRFAIWDTGDNILDSTVLVDNFRWIANGGTVAIETEPVPDGPN